jgi:hypothetical protein
MRVNAIAVFFVMLSPLGWSAAPPVQSALEARTRALVAALGSAEFRAREDATGQLLNLEETEPFLRRAHHTTKDAEVRRRLSRILDDFAQRRLQRTREAIQADGKHGRADLMAERLVHWQGRNDDDACWQPVLDLGRRLYLLERDKFKRAVWDGLQKDKLLERSFADYRRQFVVQVLPPGRPTVVVPEPGTKPTAARGERVVVNEDSVGRSLLVASEHASLTEVSGSAVFCAGSVDFRRGTEVVLVCDGDLTVEGWGGRGIVNSILVVRGSIRCSGSLQNSVIWAGGGVTFDGKSFDAREVSHCTIRAAGPISLPNKYRLFNNDLKGNVKDALSLAPVTFFEPGSLGVQVGPAKDGVIVCTAAADKPFPRRDWPSGTWWFPWMARRSRMPRASVGYCASGTC